MRQITLLPILVFATATAPFADTIVLKNGRRIVASSVAQNGDQISYETPAGRMAIPKSIVARIEHDDLTYSSATRADSQPPISAPSAPPVRGYEDVARLTVHGDSIDFAYLAQLETDARSGNALAVAKVTAAHYAAAQFLVGKGDMDAAIDHYRQALIFAPDHVALLLNLAILYLNQSQYTAALDPLEHARRVEGESGPNAANIAKLMGWAYYGSNKMDRAIEEWRRAEKIRPDAEVEQALAKAQRDKSEEESYREGETAHFSLKYYGGAAPDLARGILRALEEDFRDLESQLDYTPPEQISVILYTQQAFADITRAPGWVGALNDGRLRIPVQGVSAVTPDLARVLKHELTHSFITQKSRGRAPIWLQEGLAQWMEGLRSSSTAGSLVAAASQGAAPPLSALEGSWMGLPSNAAAFAYAWSLAVVEGMIQSGGMSDVSQLLDHIGTSASIEAALRESLHCDYSDLQQQTITYLKREYLQ